MNSASTPELAHASRQWHEHQRGEICRVGRSLFERGYVHATAGNISVRVPEAHGGGVLITPTDACLGFLQAQDLVWVGDDGQARSPGRASKTVVLHRQVYSADPTAQCTIHTHSTHLVALTLMHEGRTGQDLLPPLTPYFVMKVGHVPRIAYHRPGDPKVAQVAVRLIQDAAQKGQRLQALMCDRLGPVVWQSSAAAAMAVLEELEETARLFVLTAGQRPQALSPAQIDELREQFGASW
jgi:ribulose-5-phosphate 4-epimerase/fuculose-1-phosphate aldolase